MNNNKLRILWHSVAPWIACYDEETEVLTYDGWKKIKDIRLPESVMTYDEVTNELYFDKILNKFVYPYQGSMYRQKSKYIDLLVTLNHSMVVLKRQRDNSWKLRKCEARDILGKKVKYLKTANWNGISPYSITISNKEVSFKDFCKFMGYYLSEGYVDHTPVNGNYTVTICQNEPKLFEMAESLQKMTNNKVYFVDNRKACVRDKKLWNYLKEFGYAWDKYVPDLIRMAMKEDIEIFLRAYAEGDGGYNNETPYIITSSLRMRDNLQEIAIKAGYDSDYYLATEKGTIGNLGKSNYDCWRITLNKGIPRTVNKEVKTDSVVDFDGNVYCLEVPTHNLLVRRNGKTVICGNSGYGKVTKEICTRLPQYDIDVLISAYYGCEPGGTVPYAVPVLPAKDGNFGVVSAGKFARQYNVDIGLLFTDWWAFSDFPKMLPRATAYTPMDHTNYSEEVLNFTRQYHKLISLCKWQQSYLKDIGIESDMIYHGVDISTYKPMDKKKCKERLKLDGKFVFGTVAANSDKEDRKAHTRSMKAMRYFLDSNPDVKESDICWIYHTTSNDPRGMPLSSIAHKYKLDNVIKFMDPSMSDLMISEAELAQLMNAFDVHILCSKREGFGLPIIETQACLPGEQMVITANGSKRIDSIDDNEMMLDGKVIKRLCRKYKGLLYTIKAKGLLPVKFTDNHPILTDKGWKETKDITTDDYVVIPKLNVTTNEIVAEDRNLARLLGIYVGDGYTENYSIVLCANGMKQASEWAKLCIDVYGNARISNNYKVKCYVGNLWIKEQCGKDAKNKIVPKKILNSSQEDKIAFIEGLVESDGYIYNKNKLRITITSISRSLVDSMTLLLASLGIFNSVSVKRKDSYGIILGRKVHLNECYIMNIYGNDACKILKYPNINKNRKRKSGYETDAHLYYKIESITTECYEGTVYNLQTETSEYMTQFIVHNCGIPNINHDWSSMTELTKGHGWLCKSLGYDLNLETTPINAETAAPDVYSIAECIKEAYFKEELRLKYAKESREFALKFNWDDLVANQWVPLFKNMVTSTSVDDRRLI